ncbi:hypothetical protein EG329_010759 [Mollisiaceae sp. DMI_Dod_QoI]|nr:hypothetical protein EG329_010759 [Helotiales sp. DMI_Dod_QoI]
MPPVQKDHEEEKHESMDEDILEAKPKKRKLKYLKIRREIMVQNMNDETSYTLPNTTIKEQSRVDSNFIGSAHYYFLNRRKAREAIHGTYVIVYSRPSVYETDEEGEVISEIYEPDIKNTLCIFTRKVPEKTKGHEKVNDLLENDLIGVGMLHFKARNMTIWIQDNLADKGTTARARVFIKDTEESQETKPEGEFDSRLARNTPSSRGAMLSFGAKIMNRIHDSESNLSYRWGFEFVSLEFPCFNEYGEEDMHMVVAVKIPPKDQGEVASGFILNQKLYAPIKSDYMQPFEFDEPIRPNPKRNDASEHQKKKTKLLIAPRPQVSKAEPHNDDHQIPRKPLPSGNASSKKQLKRWLKPAQKQSSEQADNNQGVEIMDVDNSDAETIKAD